MALCFGSAFASGAGALGSAAGPALVASELGGNAARASGTAGVTAGAGTSVESFLSATLSATDVSLEGRSASGRSVIGLPAAAGAVGVSAVLGSGDVVVAAMRGAAGGSIQSSTYGTATAPTTPSTITTRTTLNQVAAKIERGARSSYSSWS
jgi:hypothetical protein